MDLPLVALFVVAWAVIGLTTGLWMIRRGHDRRWVAIALTLGPLFVPIAMERVERRPRLVASLADEASLVGPTARSGTRVLVGLDGSSESHHALTSALRLLGDGCGVLVLAEVVSYDATESDEDTSIGAASARLAAVAAGVDRQVPVRREVLVGPVGESLRRFAVDHDMDLLVVGRRGRGVSAKLLGSVSTDVVHHSAVPVLVIEPAPTTRST